MLYKVKNYSEMIQCSWLVNFNSQLFTFWIYFQMQLVYDDHDATLNVHIIQARGLRAKDVNGFSDPYVKVYMLPGKKFSGKK
jgi:hypothetical protein